MSNKFNTTGNDPAEITVSPPDSLIKYEAPLFVGIEPNVQHAGPKGAVGESTKIDDMIAAVLPPRYIDYVEVGYD